MSTPHLERYQIPAVTVEPASGDRAAEAPALCMIRTPCPCEVQGQSCNRAAGPIQQLLRLGSGRNEGANRPERQGKRGSVNFDIGRQGLHAGGGRLSEVSGRRWRLGPMLDGKLGKRGQLRVLRLRLHRLRRAKAGLRKSMLSVAHGRRRGMLGDTSMGVPRGCPARSGDAVRLARQSTTLVEIGRGSEIQPTGRGC